MDTTYGADYTTLYDQHWWWRSRERILLHELDRLELAKQAEILDVGCGNGLFMAQLSQFGDVRGIEVDTSLLTDETPSRDRISTKPLGGDDFAPEQFDLITACDVIEHIEDDISAVSRMRELLKPSGYCLITVPAFPALWDHHDDINHHYRRYHQADVNDLLMATGFEVMHCRYLFHAIFLPKLAVKTWNRGRQQKVAQHRLPSTWINQTMQAICYSEYRMTRALAPPPFGTSVLAIARRA